MIAGEPAVSVLQEMKQQNLMKQQRKDNAQVNVDEEARGKDRDQVKQRGNHP